MVLEIFKMIATSGFLTALECTKLVSGQGFSPYPLAGLRGPNSKGRGGTVERDRRRGRERELKGPPPPPP